MTDDLPGLLPVTDEMVGLPCVRCKEPYRKGDYYVEVPMHVLIAPLDMRVPMCVGCGIIEGSVTDDD